MRWSSAILPLAAPGSALQQVLEDCPRGVAGVRHGLDEVRGVDVERARPQLDLGRIADVDGGSREELAVGILHGAPHESPYRSTVSASITALPGMGLPARDPG